jgi:predicted nucleotidyltransferase
MAEATAARSERLLTLPSLAEDDGLVSAEKILYAVQRIVELAGPLKVVAFGSRARGDHRPESDLDLAVVVDQYDPKSGLPPVTRPDLDVWMPIDLVVYDAARELALRDSLISLQYVVEREGVLLYDRTAGFVDRGVVERLV